MKIQKKLYSAAAAGLFASNLMGIPAYASSAKFTSNLPLTAASVKGFSPDMHVIVKLGDAMLEEYHGGNPADRTQTYRGGDETCRTSQKPAEKLKRRA